jgi:hypothetical protein
VVTTITIRVLPDGHYTMRFHSRGDSADVFNEDFPHPATGEWSQSSVEDDEDDTWIQITHGLFSGKIEFPINSTSSIPLRHVLTVDKTDGWIATHYKLEYQFQGREAFRKYPEFARQITGVSSDSTQWISEALTYIVSQGMEDIQTAQKFSIDPDLAERIQNHMRGYFSRIKEKDLFEELNQDFLRKAFSPFIRDVPHNYIQHLSEAMTPYEEELRITSGLTDDEIRLHVFLPGAVTSHNADSILGDTLQWTFGLEDFLNDDYKIRAASIVYSPRQIQAVILGITVLVLLILWITFKSRNRH